MDIARRQNIPWRHCARLGEPYESEKADPGPERLTFLKMEFCDGSALLSLLGPVAQVKKVLHFAAFITIFMLFVRAIGHLPKRMFCAPYHIEH